MKLENIKNKFFNSSADRLGNGLFVSFDELVAQRRYVYRWQNDNMKNFTSLNAEMLSQFLRGEV